MIQSQLFAKLKTQQGRYNNEKKLVSNKSEL